MRKPSVLQKILRQETKALEVDWSVISLSGVNSLLKDLLAEVLGVSRPPLPSTYEMYRSAFRRVDIKDLYRNVYSLAASNRPRFLIKAVVYDMPCFIKDADYADHVNSSTANDEMGSGEAILGGRDWTNVLHMNTPMPETTENSSLPIVNASDVMQRLGVKGIRGLEDRLIDPMKTVVTRKSRLEEKQKLEEVLGSGDSIRAKYLEKIRQKKIMAESRRERERFTDNAPSTVFRATPLNRSWSVTPGSPALVRYLEERGIMQALISRGNQSQLNDLLVELRNYKFKNMRDINIGESKENSSEDILKAAEQYGEIVNSFCATWGLSPWQVLLVVGDSALDKALQKAIEGSQYFICKVGRIPSTEGKDSHDTRSQHSENVQAGWSIHGILDWYKKLSEGKLDDNLTSGSSKSLLEDKSIHFSVKDMTELKWIIEDMNGVSYKSSTFVQGFS